MALITDNILKSTDLLIPVTFLHDAHDEEESRTSYHTRTCTPPPDPPQSLADELRSKLEDVTFSLKPNGREFDVGGINGSLKRNEGCGESMYEENYFVSNDEYEDEGTFEELLAVDPQMITEVAMLQKENEWWGTEQRKLEMEKRKLREEKDAFERYVHTYCTKCACVSGQSLYTFVKIYSTDVHSYHNILTHIAWKSCTQQFEVFTHEVIYPLTLDLLAWEVHAYRKVWVLEPDRKVWVLEPGPFADLSPFSLVHYVASLLSLAINFCWS